MCSVGNKCGVGTGGKKRLDGAFDTIMEVFDSYAAKGGDRYQLSYSELRGLLQNELTTDDGWDQREILDIMDDLDKNKNGRVSFEEFVSLVTMLTMCSRVYFREYTFTRRETVVIDHGWKRK